MEPQNVDENPQHPVEERRLRIEEKRLLLDNSFARKWLPTLVTLMVGLIAAMFSYVQQQNAIQATERTKIEAKTTDEREYGFKVIEMYFSNRELFDIAKNPEQAGSNLRVLAAVAPTAVRGVLNVEQSRIPPPRGTDDSSRLDSLSAVAGVQEALKNAEQSPRATFSGYKSSDFTIYVQYPEGGRDAAIKTQSLLDSLGYRVPGIEKVNKTPSRLQVRYYLPDQHSYAGKLATVVGKEINMKTGPDNAILVTSTKQLPSGILEVWIPSN